MLRLQLGGCPSRSLQDCCSSHSLSFRLESPFLAWHALLPSKVGGPGWPVKPPAPRLKGMLGDAQRGAWPTARGPAGRKTGWCKPQARGWASQHAAAHLLTYLCSPALWALRLPACRQLPYYPGRSPPGSGHPSQDTPLTTASEHTRP